jgi:Flp pilus assembly protein TadD
MNKFYATLCERFGLNAYIAGDYQKAERWFRKLEQSEPTSIRVLRNLGVILLAKGRSEEAERYLLREEKLYGASFYRHSALADLTYATGKRKEAARRYRLALREPECAEGGKMYHMRGIMEKRLAMCEDEKRYTGTRKAMEFFRQAEESREAGAHQEAIQKFLQSFALDETNWPALNNAASIYMNTLKQPAEAEPLFSQAFELSHSIQVARNVELCRQAINRGQKKK